MTTEDEKNRIRERYKGGDTSTTIKIPAIPKPSIYDDTTERRVGVYARVSTDNLNQTSSYELQKNYYTDLIDKNPMWHLVDIYADEGISGTSLNHREEFKRMIADCRAGKLDLIITKNVARFARNIVDCISYARELKALKNPVYIIFESQNINTRDDDSEMQLSIHATLAQHESHAKSNTMNASIDMRYSKDLFLVCPLLGYDVDENKQLVINEEEAKVVRFIFFMYMSGATCQQIADTLTEYGIKTKRGNTKWAPSSILQILQNERECGDLIARKTWTPNFLDHKSKKNNNDKTQYKKPNHHEGIISRADFMAVQQLINNAKYRHKGFLPELRVIKEGLLKGFVPIVPTWAGFSADDYILASKSAYDDNSNDNVEIKLTKGDFDYRHFQILSALYADSQFQPCINFTCKSITFSSACFSRLNTSYVELLVNPTLKIFAVRHADPKKCRNAVKWYKFTQNIKSPRPINGRAFLTTLYQILGWNINNKYQIIADIKTKDNNAIMFFHLKETKIFISKDTPDIELDKIPTDTTPFTNGPKKNIIAYPKEWKNSFGKHYYERQAKELQLLAAEEWNINHSGSVYDEENKLQVTSENEITQQLETLKEEMNNNGE